MSEDPPRRKKLLLGGLSRVKLKTTKTKKRDPDERLRVAYTQMQAGRKERKERLETLLKSKRSRKHEIRSKNLVDRTSPAFKTMNVLVCQYGMGLRGHEKRISELLKKYAPIDFVVCPENFASPDLQKEIGVPMAKHFKTYFNGGSGINVKKGGTKYYNTAVVVDREGSVLVSYDKRKAWTGQECGTAPGFFKTDFGKGSVLICLDIEDEGLVDETIRNNTRIIVNPTHIPTTHCEREKNGHEWSHGLEEMSRRLGYYATKHDFCVFRSDVPGPIAGGTSQIITPRESRFASTSHECSIIARIKYRRQDGVVKFEKLNVDETLIRNKSTKFDLTGARCVIKSLPCRFSRSSSLCVVKSSKILIRASNHSRTPEVWNLHDRNKKQNCDLKSPSSDELDINIPIIKFSNPCSVGAISTTGIACTWKFSETKVKRDSKAVIREFCTKYGGVTDFDLRKNSLAMVCAKNAAIAIYDTRSPKSSLTCGDDGDIAFSGKHFLGFGETEYDMRLVTQNGVVSILDTRKASRAVHSLDLSKFLGGCMLTSCLMRSLNESSFGMVGSSCGDAALLEFDMAKGIQILSSSRNLHNNKTPIRSISSLGSNAVLTCDDVGSSHLWTWTDDDSDTSGVSLLRHQETFVESTRIQDVSYVSSVGTLAFSCEDVVCLYECRLNNESIPWEAAVY